MFSKSLFASKTFWINLLAGFVGVAGEASGLIPAAYAPYIAAAVGIANIILRLVSNGPVHVVTPQTVTQATPDAPVVKVPTQAGFARLDILLATMAVSIAIIAGCATATPSADAKTAAYAAQTTADMALKSIPSLLATKTISKATAEQINAAALAVNSAALAVYSCTSTTSTDASCSTAALTTALATLSQLVPAAK